MFSKNKNKQKNKKNKSKLFLAIGLVVILLGLLLVLFIPKINSEQSIDAPNNPIANKQLAIKGLENAPVTIIEYSDYECSYCQRFYLNTLPSIEKEYVETGLVKIITKEFPLDFHKNAQMASEAALCAGEQGKYFEMQDKLFIDGVKGGAKSYKGYAEDIGLDTTTFNNCLDKREKKAEVLKDLKEGQLKGVTGTPAFFINGEMVVGAQPFDVFKEVINRKLLEAQ